MNLEPIKKELEKKLAIFKDPNFLFNEEEHTYHYRGIKYESVTSYIKRFKETFDKEYWSKRKAQERGVDVSLVLNEWQIKADEANDLGTKVHKWIEDFWSGNARDLTTEDDHRLVDMFLF